MKTFLDVLRNFQAELGLAGRGLKLAWAFFIFTCFQLVFLRPYVVLLAGERANLFSGALCAFSLILALIFGDRRGLGVNKMDVQVSLVLTALVFISSALSATPVVSLSRAFTLTGSALGGYWCARLLLHKEAGRRFLVWFGLALLAGVMVLLVLGVVKTGRIHTYIDSHWHPTGGRVLLLSFAPLALASASDKLIRALGLVFLGLCYVMLVLAAKYAGMESVAIIPAILLLVAACCGPWRRRTILVLAAAVFLSSAVLGKVLIDNAFNLQKNHISVAYRVENVYFSWRIASDNPWLGLGLLAPRESYLTDYQLHYPHLDKAHFVQWTRELRTSENSFLTFLTDLGLPFVIIYTLSLLALGRRVLWLSFHDPPGLALPPLALLLPLAGELLHLQVMDGFLQPTIAFYFHLLLGLIPEGKDIPALVPGRLKNFCVRGLLFGAVLVAGVGVGLVWAGL
ncbi:MAG: O-antigen ligase family protein [Thermodesulfobacteriota bacterium]